MPTPTNVQASTNVFVQNQDTLFNDGNDGSTALKATPTVSLAKLVVWDGSAFQLARQAVTGSITSPLLGITNVVPLGRYNASTLSLTDGDFRGIQLSKNAELITSQIDLPGVLTSITAADTGSTTVTGQNSQSIITGTPTAGSFVAVVPTGDSSFAVRVSGSFVGTLQFERTVDGLSWTPISADVSGTNFIVSQISNIGSFHGNSSSCTGVRVRCLTLTSGSPSLQFLTGAGVNTIRIGNPLRLFDPTSGMVATIKAASTPVVAADTAIVVDVRSYPGPVAQTVTISAGTSLSSAINLNSAFPVGLNVPTGWTAANITFRGSQDGGITYNNARTGGGSEVTVNVTIAGDSYNLNPLDFGLYTHLQIRSGTAATSVGQVSAASLTLSTRGSL